jgi:hypothetical protein
VVLNIDRSDKTEIKKFFLKINGLKIFGDNQEKCHN